MILGAFNESWFEVVQRQARQRQMQQRLQSRPPAAVQPALNCNHQYAQCMNSRLPYTRKHALCSARLRGCKARAHFHGTEFGYVDPYVRMAEGVEPRWNPRDPRSPLTNVSRMAYEQSHPQMNGAGGFSIWAWLRGDYR